MSSSSTTNSKDFSGKVVLITGSSGGIGAALSRHFARSGAQVVVNGRNGQNVGKVASDCNSLSPKKLKALQVVADVTIDDDCRRLVDTVICRLGRIDILVNNAGAGAFGSIYDPKLMQTYDHMMKLDVRSVVLITQLVVPHLERTKGVIVNISSSLSVKPNVHFMPYCLAKCAIDMFTKCMALELGPKGIRCNSVNPTAVRTNFQSATGAGDILVGVLKQLEETNPLRRIATVDDVVNAVAFLASGESGFVTGTALMVDGASIWV
ncbi:L-xylulose reductase-like [Oppia nitens]|uniref:L-xylulose reductase-like n=1 Tax=Oppia nitens TaxID=1686743 RepID=UPI0023DA7C2A|nr:L-xylulose reductase-like [Oppia nitens]XP_054154658.1 L-xylulose reductase-like [Oppia nitens]